MTKISLDLSEEAHFLLLELQLEMKKKKVEPTAINKIAAQVLEEALKTKKPAK